MNRKPPSLDKPYRKHRAVLPQEAQVWRETMDETLPLPLAGEADSVNEANPNLANPVRDLSARQKPSFSPLPHAGEGFRADLASVAGKKTRQLVPVSMDKSTFAKLKRGKQRPRAMLDLHGHTRVTAHSALLRFIAEARMRGGGVIIVITGKGRAGGGALRELLPGWLEASPLREAVISFSLAGPRHGGDGAWYLRIRKGG